MRRSSRIVQLLHSAAGRAAPAATAAGGPAPAAAAAAAALRSASSSSAAAGSAAAATSRASWQRLALATGLCVGAAGAGLLAIGGGTADCDAPAPEGDAPDGAVPALARRKTRIVVLGSGWGAMSFLKSLDPKSFGREQWMRLCAAVAGGSWGCAPACCHLLAVRSCLPTSHTHLPRLQIAPPPFPAADGKYELVVVSPRSYFL